MKGVLIFITNMLVCIGIANAAVRDGTSVNRQKSPTQSVQQRISTESKSARSSRGRTSVLTPRATQNTTARSATTQNRTTNARKTSNNRTTVSRSAQPTVSARATSGAQTPAVETRTGAEYEQCKTAYFTCMDQFCSLKNDDYRRCACSNRIYALSEQRDTLTDAGEQLTVFNENLDIVGLTSAQATAMRTESDGESALMSDTSASKALLDAIMNSIRGQDASVSGKYSDLNSINLSFDATNAFGTMDAGQAIAAYDGQNLYSAVYPQCRAAVRADCNDASLQRAITAYLMAIEQDCNTVATAIENTQKQLKSAVRESSAMLDLARVENRQKHNSDDITTCINNVEAAILNENVCGAGYHKCLDNGEFIDISTGQPIAGVEDFYKLETLLTFADGLEAADQKLSKMSSNAMFVHNFENRTKKFAADALDKCREDADIVWAEYLDKAMLSIYYAQKDKVSEIKQNCFDYISQCYMDGETSIDAAMSALGETGNIVLQPQKVALNAQMCSDYVNSCNNMFQDQGNIIEQYIANRTDTDRLTACRAIAQQCFDNYGNTNYENFYYPYSGLFTTGRALDWFTLYEYSGAEGSETKSYKSECAKQLANVEACNDPELIEQAFGGFDSIPTNNIPDDTGYYNYFYETTGEGEAVKQTFKNIKYGIASGDAGAIKLKNHNIRPTGIATEVYNKTIAILSTQCTNLMGRFMELHTIDTNSYQENNLCVSTFTTNEKSKYHNLNDIYKFAYHENMCPRNYDLDVDTQSWGACLCWENGGRRSKAGASAKCVAALPVIEDAKDAVCSQNDTASEYTLATATTSEDKWCTQSVISKYYQVCPLSQTGLPEGLNCETSDKTDLTDLLPQGVE